jgi:hypothetical protein
MLVLMFGALAPAQTSSIPMGAAYRGDSPFNNVAAVGIWGDAR